jgi:hypothetical protein
MRSIVSGGRVRVAVRLMLLIQLERLLRFVGGYACSWGLTDALLNPIAETPAVRAAVAQATAALRSALHR